MAEDRKNDARQATVVKQEWLDGSPIAIHCRCGGLVTIFAPFSEDYVVCPRCESKLWTPLEQGKLPPPEPFRRSQSGVELVEITLASGEMLIATPDHPMRTARASMGEHR